MATYHEKLKLKMDSYVRLIYKVTKDFPKDELFGVTSQLRRSALSVILNYIEGYARRRGNDCKVYKNFMKISYGSLKESKYLVYFSFRENYMKESDYKILISLADEIGAMVYKVID